MDEDIKKRFQQIAVIAVTSNGVEDYKVIDIENKNTHVVGNTKDEKSTNFYKKSNFQTEITAQKLSKTNFVNSFSTEEIIIFILSIVTICVTLIAFIIFCFIIKKNKKDKQNLNIQNSARKIDVKRLYPVNLNYSITPSIMV